MAEGSTGKILHWGMWIGMIIPALAMLPVGGTILGAAQGMLTHMFGPLFTNPGLVLTNGFNMVANTLNAVGLHVMTPMAVDPASTASAMAGMNHTTGALSATDAFAKCKAGLSAAQMGQVQAMASAQGVAVDSYLQSSGLCHVM